MADTAMSFPPAPNGDSFAHAVSQFVAPQGPAAALWFAPDAFGAPVTQWFAGFTPADTFSVPAMQPSSPGLAAMETSSVFSTGSGDGWGGADVGSFIVSELPFTGDSFDDTPIYTASADTPWILVADFTGDGWFFV